MTDHLALIAAKLQHLARMREYHTGLLEFCVQAYGLDLPAAELN